MPSRPFTRGGEAFWHHVMGRNGLSAHGTVGVIGEEVRIDIHRV
jgi:hypothetical protein